MMKQTIKTMLALLALLVSSTGAWAFDTGDVTWTNSASGNGTITCKSVVEDLSYYHVTITVTPATNYSIIGSNIVAANKADETDKTVISEAPSTNYGASRDITFICPKTWTGVNLTATFVPSMVSIGTNKYPSLASAFDAVLANETKTIKIDTDINETGADYDFPGGTRNITIDLNGKNVTFTRDIHGKIGDLSIINGTGTVVFGDISNQGDVTITGSTLTCGSLSSVYNLTITNSTLNCTNINNSMGGNTHTLLIDNSTVTCDNGDYNSLQWMADFITLQNNAILSVKKGIFIAFDDDFRLSIDNTSQLQLTACSISGYNYTRAATEINKYAPLGTTVVADGSTLNTVLLKEYSHTITITDGTASVGGAAATSAKYGQTVTVTADAAPAGQYFIGWTAGTSDNVTFANASATTTTFTMPDNNVTITANYSSQLALVSNLTNAAVTFYKSNAVPTVAFIDSPGSVANLADAGDYIVMHIVPNDGYWTNLQLLMAMETGASLAPQMRAPGLELGQVPTLLKADEGYSNGAGWYYYQIPAGHSVNDGYVTSTIDGFVAPKFDLSTATVDANDAKTYHVSNGDWNTTISIDKNSFTYNGAAQGPQLSGTTMQVKKGNDDACTLPLIGNVTLSSTATNASATAYDATLSSVANGCFTSTKAIPFTIGKKALTVTAKAKTITYGDAPANDGVTYTGFADGENENTDGIFGTSTLSYAYSYAQYGNVGDAYTITPSGLTATNYDITFNTGTLTVNQKEVGLNWGTTSLTYNGSAQAPACEATGLVNNDVINVTVTGAQTATGNYTATATALTGDKTGNYKMPAANTKDFTINPKRVNDSNTADDKDTDIIIEQNGSATVSASYTYNGSGQKPTITVKDGTTVIPEGEYTISYKDANDNVVDNPTNVGTYTVVITDNDGGNYNVSGTTTFVINQKALTITADNASKVYDGTALTKNSYTNSALATGDAITSVTITGSQINVGTSNNVPSAAIIKKGNVDVTANYNITYVNGTLEVTKKTVKDNPGDGEGAVSIVLTDISVDGFTYNGNGQKPTITVKDGTNADAQVIPANEYTITIKDSKGNTVTDPKDAGTYTVVITDNDGGNYDVSGETTFTINKKTLTITANDQEKAAGSDDPTLTYTQDGLVAGDAITGALTRATGETVGTYAITLGTLSAGNNYTINFTEATLTIYRDLQMAEMFSGTNEWASMIAQEDLAVPAGMAAYIVTGVSGNNIITKEISYIPAGVPIILQKKDNTASGKATAGTGTDDVSENLLKGSATEASTIQPYKDYVLYNGRFELAGISSVPAGKVYLPATALNGTTAPQYLSIGDNYTGVKEVREVNASLEVKDDSWYTIDGRKLDKKPTQKGIYINGGRKVVVK